MPRITKLRKAAKKERRSQSKNINGNDSETESICESVSGISVNNSVDCNDDTSDYESDKEVKTETISNVYSKLDDSMDLLNDKSAQQRIKAFRRVSNIVANYYVPDYVSKNRLNIIDGIKRSLRRGDNEEQIIAANLAPLICLQLSFEFQIDDLMTEIKPILTKIFQDHSKNMSVRAKCCTSLALLTFLVDKDMFEIIKTIEEITREVTICFSPSHVKITEPTFYVVLLSAWNLLLSVLDSSHAFSLFETPNSYVPPLEKFHYVLSSDNVELRLESGQSLAIIYEIGRLHSLDFCQHNLDELLPVISDLAKVSHKHRAKKDQKTQRITFRLIEDFLERNIDLNTNTAKFGDDVINLDTWCRMKQYQHICDLLGSGINLHMARNQFIRKIFDLSIPLSLDEKAKVRKSSKLEKNLMNAATSKARTISRNKARGGKRTDGIEFSEL